MTAETQGWRPIELRLRAIEPEGSTFEEMRAALLKTDFWKDGDTVLRWVNEGDLLLLQMLQTMGAVVVPAPLPAPPSDAAP